MIRGILALLLLPGRAWAYQREDHFYTVRLLLSPKAFTADEAALAATCAQLPDEVPELSAIDTYRRLMKHPLDYSGWVVSRRGPAGTVGRMVTVQQLLHGLTGGSPQALRGVAQRIVKDALESARGAGGQARADSLCALGFAFHLYGDSFSHRMIHNPDKMYHTGVGHLFDSARPDFPLFSPARLALWREYMLSLAGTASAMPPAVGRALTDAQEVQATASEENGYNVLELRRRLAERIRSAGIDDLHTPFDRRLADRGCQAVIARQALVDGLAPAPGCESSWRLFRETAVREFDAYEAAADGLPLRDPAYAGVPYFTGSPFDKGPAW